MVSKKELDNLQNEFYSLFKLNKILENGEFTAGDEAEFQGICKQIDRDAMRSALIATIPFALLMLIPAIALLLTLSVIK